MAIQLRFVRLVLLLALTLAAPVAAQDQTAEFEALKPKIQALIGQLGDEDFAVRQQAQERLRRYGAIAFDALREAQEHDDVEIARRARYLVRSFQVRWGRPTDAPLIVNTLKEYGALPETARSRLLDRLASLSEGVGVPALCRIARFESSDQLARRAALLVASRKPNEQAEAREREAAIILKELGVSRRTSTDWLRAYVATLRNPDSAVDAWGDIVATVFDKRDRLPNGSNDSQIETLLRIYVDALIRADDRDSAEKNATRLLTFVRGRRDTILDAIDWLLERELYAVIEELVQSYPQQAERFLTIRYRLAESQRRQGKKELAEQSAKAALMAKPDAFDAHVRAAIELQERALLDWCIRELETVIKNADSTNLHHIHARLLLSEMHHDYEREVEAAETIAPVAKLLENGDKETRDRVRQPPISRTAEGIIARMHLFYALVYRAKGEYAKQLEHLTKGSEVQADDADVLIAMFHAKGADESFKNRTAELIDAFLDRATDQIRELKEYESRSPNESTRNDVRNAVAMMHNQFAWLACNTERHLQNAIRSSHRSLELRPNTAAYLDTLAHCYAAVNDYENAVKYQREAVRLEPYSFQIGKKLKIFQEKLAKAKQDE